MRRPADGAWSAMPVKEFASAVTKLSEEDRHGYEFQEEQTDAACQHSSRWPRLNAAGSADANQNVRQPQPDRSDQPPTSRCVLHASGGEAPAANQGRVEKAAAAAGKSQDRGQQAFAACLTTAIDACHDAFDAL